MSANASQKDHNDRRKDLKTHVARRMVSGGACVKGEGGVTWAVAFWNGAFFSRSSPCAHLELSAAKHHPDHIIRSFFSAL